MLVNKVKHVCFYSNMFVFLYSQSNTKMHKKLNQVQKRDFIELNRHLIDYDEIAKCTVNPRKPNSPYSRITVKAVLNRNRENEHILDTAVAYIKRRLTLIRDIQAKNIEQLQKECA